MVAWHWAIDDLQNSKETPIGEQDVAWETSESGEWQQRNTQRNRIERSCPPSECPKAPGRNDGDDNNQPKICGGW